VIKVTDDELRETSAQGMSENRTTYKRSKYLPAMLFFVKAIYIYIYMHSPSFVLFTFSRNRLERSPDVVRTATQGT
jgi:hypothetical protein